MLPSTIQRSAVFSPCKTWRYTLERTWDESKGRVVFVLLNPSTADAVQDDRTNRRGMSFANDWGHGACDFVNLFAVRTPYPEVMKMAVDPVGPDNDEWIDKMCSRAKLVVVAWGNHGGHRGRNDVVHRMIRKYKPKCLAVTKLGQPKHILYIIGSAMPKAFI